MSNQQQAHSAASQSQPIPQGSVEIQSYLPPSTQAQELVEFFRNLENRQVDFLNEAGKSLVERIATFLTILLGASVLSNNFPPTYLKADLLARLSIFAALGCYLLAMGIAMWTIQPRWGRRYTHNIEAMELTRDQIIKQKMRGVRVAGVLFLLGSISLAILIVDIAWKITQ